MPVAVQWDAFKLRRRYETQRGDIAIVVVRDFDDSSSAMGAAFLEAKRIYAATSSFDGIKSWEQLERMQQISHHHHLLLYDFQEVVVGAELVADHWVRTELTGMRQRRTRQMTHAVVVPTNYALAFRLKSRALYRQGNPFAYQICTRYAAGFDLEYDESSLQTAIGYLEGIGAGPRYIVVMFVNRVELGERPAVLVNSDRYIRIGEAE